MWYPRNSPRDWARLGSETVEISSGSLDRPSPPGYTLDDKRRDLHPGTRRIDVAPTQPSLRPTGCVHSMTEIGVGIGQPFTTRPELQGRFGMVSSTHWLASGAGMRMLELGGNAFDAAVAAGFVLQVVQPHLNGPGGDLPVLIWDARLREPRVLCAQGVAPAAATPDHFRSLGLDAIPGTGLLAACVPGAMDGWLLLLRDHGTLTLRQVIEPAIEYCLGGYPAGREMTRVIAASQQLMEEEWQTSAEIYLESGSPPTPGSTFRNKPLAATFIRLLKEGESKGSTREATVDAARDTFYRGFIAEAIVDFIRDAQVMDATGMRSRGLISGDDLAKWSATWEPSLTTEFHDITVCKAGPWSQAPVLLQQLALLEGFSLESMSRSGPDYVHTIIEATKLAYSDREAWYGDPLFADVPIESLISLEYAVERRALIDEVCSLDYRPGHPSGRVPRMTTRMPGTDRPETNRSNIPGIGEPTVEIRASCQTPGSTLHSHDTCHVDVVDRLGNMVSATPSGGWLQSSPVVPGLGFALGTRMQMFDLNDGLPNQVQPGKRPRTTLSPTLALRDGSPWLAFGTPGGDQQDQWSLQFLLNVAVFGDDLQLAIDRPVFQSAHFPSSFYPHESIPGRVYIEDRYPSSTLDELRRRGHDVQTTGPWSLSRVCAVGRNDDGALRAGANPRGMEGYAAGR
jgi:gamma-glutamyltranspeptidase / glutathione hydrolase